MPRHYLDTVQTDNVPKLKDKKRGEETGPGKGTLRGGSSSPAGFLAAVI